MSKLLSGRFILTITAGVIWFYLAAKGMMATEFSAGLITLIVRDYFARNDRTTGGK